jgi:hypothetical protein
MPSALARGERNQHDCDTRVFYRGLATQVNGPERARAPAHSYIHQRSRFILSTLRKEWTSTPPQELRDIYSFEQIAAAFKLARVNFTQAQFAAAEAAGKIQQGKLNLVVNVIMVNPDEDLITIGASINQSSVSCGKMTTDTDTVRGVYQDKIHVEMWLEKDSQPCTQFSRITDGPQTVECSGSTSSSVSVSLGANVGFFGDTPTGGANVGISDTRSFSQNLQDFKVVNTSDNRKVVHDYLMSKSSGGAHNKATDLWPNGDQIGLMDLIQGVKMYYPPDLATSNLPLISQCIWQADPGFKLSANDVLFLRLEIRQFMPMVTGQLKGVYSQASAVLHQVIYQWAERIPLGTLVKTDVSPMS